MLEDEDSLPAEVDASVENGVPFPGDRDVRLVRHGEWGFVDLGPLSTGSKFPLRLLRDERRHRFYVLEGPRCSPRVRVSRYACGERSEDSELGRLQWEPVDKGDLLPEPVVAVDFPQEGAQPHYGVTLAPPRPHSPHLEETFESVRVGVSRLLRHLLQIGALLQGVEELDDIVLSSCVSGSPAVEAILVPRVPSLFHSMRATK